MIEQIAALDRAFHALSDRTRRALLERLTNAPASVGELAKPFSTTLAAIVQHVQVLEHSGLIATKKFGRERTCRMADDGLARVERWLAGRRHMWEKRFDRRGALLAGTTGRRRVKRAAKRRRRSRRCMPPRSFTARSH
jgi:DNA-binding transcriptional ArsR family regulator